MARPFRQIYTASSPLTSRRPDLVPDCWQAIVFVRRNGTCRSNGPHLGGERAKRSNQILTRMIGPSVMVPALEKMVCLGKVSLTVASAGIDGKDLQLSRLW